MTRHQPHDFDTLCPGAGQGRRDGESLVTPIVQSTTFCRDGLESQAEVRPHRRERTSQPRELRMLGDQVPQDRDGAPVGL